MKRMLLPLVFAACTAHAEYKDGNKLLSEMKGSQFQQMSALGYVVGVADALEGVTVCSPDSVTAGQIHDMVKQFLENNPGLRHFTGDAIVNRVLSKAWPCKKGTGT